MANESSEVKGRGNPFLEEFTDFVNFMKSLWGILTGISLFFPISNSIVKVIPFKYVSATGGHLGGVNNFTPELITSISTVITLFMTLSIFGKRFLIMKLDRKTINARASFSFWVGIGCIVSYVYLLYGGGNLLISNAPKLFTLLVVDILYLFSYSMFFMFVTRAFMLLSIVEYYRLPRAQPQRDKQ